MKRVNFKKHLAGRSGSNGLQGINAIEEARALERRDQAVVISILRFDRDYLAVIADPFCEAQRKETDVCPDVDNQGPSRYKFLKSLDWAGFEVSFVDRIKLQDGRSRIGRR
jgi:hypothetical protein